MAEVGLTMNDCGSQLVERWRTLNLEIAPGNSENQIREFETSNHVLLPQDFRRYLLRVNGMKHVGGQDCDPNGFAFWPLSRVKSVRREYSEHPTPLPNVLDPDVYFVFVDYLQWCWAYAIRLGNSLSEPNPIIHVGTVRRKTVAGSFTEFVNLYLRDARELYVDAETIQPAP